MLLSKYFLPTFKEKPADAQVISHSLMLRSGMIRQHGAGLYSWLPIGLKALQNVINIIRKNMNKSGCIELIMPCIQPSSLWIESGRFDDYGKEMLRFQDRHDNTLLFGPTNEEMLTDICRNSIKSYRELPRNFYQIQWKFRDEIRPRFGVMRGREFLMKDGYSLDLDYESAKRSYELMYNTYIKTFNDMGIKVIPVIADNGAIGGSLSHEFQILADTGESLIYYDKEFDNLSNNIVNNIDKIRNLYAADQQKHDPDNCPLSHDQINTKRGIEVGHIFYFGSKYSQMMNAFVNDQNGNRIPLEMGSYGIGVSRVVAAIIEASHDDRGIIWTKPIAPFKVAIVNLNINNTKCNELASNAYNTFINSDLDVLYDDTSESVGVKLSINDLIGTPWQIIIGPKYADKDMVELKNRITGEIKVNTLSEAINKIHSDFGIISIK